MKLSMQSQKGFTGVEVVVAIIALIVFVSVIATVFTNFYVSDIETKRYAVASAYVTELIESIDRMYYEDVQEDKLKEKIEQMKVSSGYTLTATITPYQEDSTKDLVKTVTVKVSYLVGKAEKTIEIKRIKAKEMLIIPNKPKLAKGMVPVKYVTSDTSGEGYWEVTTENDSTWYSYENKKWANIMLQDGLTVEGNVKVTDENRQSLVGKKITTLGSMFVWIPRYAYKIPDANVHTSNAAEIDIIFLYSTSDYYIDENGNRQPISNKTGYKIHPSFQNGEKTNYANGEWDSELTGYWVAKFEASSSNSTTTNGGGNVTNLNVKVLPGVTSWRGIDVKNTFTVCQKMSDDGNIYQLTSNTDSHMMKNSEWGAVAYLTQSKYGKNVQVWNNSNSNYITGMVGSKKDAINETSTASYNSENGPKASTTGNVYGIYDMSGGAWEYVAAYIDNTYAKNSTNITSLKDAQPKYKNTYVTAGGDTESQNYEANKEKYGDAIYETSIARTSDESAWYQGTSYFASSNNVMLMRSGIFNTTAGTYCFKKADGASNSTVSFRPVLTIP